MPQIVLASREEVQRQLPEGSDQMQWGFEDGQLKQRGLELVLGA